MYKKLQKAWFVFDLSIRERLKKLYKEHYEGKKFVVHGEPTMEANYRYISTEKRRCIVNSLSFSRYSGITALITFYNKHTKEFDIYVRYFNLLDGLKLEEVGADR